MNDESTSSLKTANCSEITSNDSLYEAFSKSANAFEQVRHWLTHKNYNLGPIDLDLSIIFNLKKTLCKDRKVGGRSVDFDTNSNKWPGRSVLVPAQKRSTTNT